MATGENLYISRRDLLIGGGTAAIAAAFLAACGGGGSGSQAAPAETAAIPTEESITTFVEPTTPQAATTAAATTTANQATQSKLFTPEPLKGFAAPYIGVNTGDRVQYLKGDKTALDDYFASLAMFGNVTRLDAEFGGDISNEMAAARKYGIGVILLVANNYDPADPEALAGFAGDLAGLYGAQNDGSVVAFEVGGNEPNLGTPDPARFAMNAVLQARAVKAAGGGYVDVISGGLAPGVTLTDGTEMSPAVFTRKWLEAISPDERKLFDMVGMHPYDYPSVSHSEAWSAWHQMADGPGEIANGNGKLESETVRDVLAALGMPAVIAITEVGATTTGPDALTEEAQAKVVEHALMSEINGIETKYRIIFTLQDDNSQQDEGEKGFGVDNKLAGKYIKNSVSAARA